MVRQWQQMFFNSRYAATEMVNPDFVALAGAYGIEAHRVTQREELREAIGAMLAAEGPYIMETVISREANILPMVEPGASVSDVTLTYR
jgi:acetolactate synthase-1/2/3 large subunit